MYVKYGKNILIKNEYAIANLPIWKTFNFLKIIIQIAVETTE